MPQDSILIVPLSSLGILAAFYPEVMKKLDFVGELWRLKSDEGD